MPRFADYLLSLPERVVRSTSALTAGLLREIGDAALPARLRRTVLYRTMVESTLRFLIERVGEVEGTYSNEEAGPENFLVQRAVGDGVDLAGIVAFHASPVWVLAALADISGAGRDLIDEITSSLKDEGLLDRDTVFESIEQVLDGLERTAGQLALSLRMPPLNVAALRKDWRSLKEAASSIPPREMPPPEEIRGQWEALANTAQTQQRSVFQISSLLALSSLRAVPEHLVWLSRSARTATLRTGRFFGEGLLEHYRTTLGEIHTMGYLEYCEREYRPYLRAAAQQFSRSHQTLTERLLRR
jgi:hypothetical protein